MSDLSVIERDGSLVVDSRLVAERLEVQHEVFMRTVSKYLSEVQDLGVIRFENGKPAEGSKGGRPERYCFLNEEQATFLMTLSRNSAAVVQCKKDLVVAFKKAQSIIKTVIPAQSARMQELDAENRNLELKIQILEAQQKTLSAAGLMALTAPAIVEAIMLPGVTVIEKVEHIDRTVIVDQRGSVISQLDGVGITAIQKQFGFKSTKAAWAWLESIGYGKDSGYWEEEQTAHPASKLKRSAMAELKLKFAQRKGDRQSLIGEFV